MRSRLRMGLRLFVGFAVVVAATAVFAVNAPSALAVCSGNVARTTASSQTTVDGFTGYWSTPTDTAGAPCVDVNVINEGWDDNAFVGAYYSGGAWHHGTAGWVGINEGYLGVVITSLSGTGIPVKAANRYDGGNWDIRILT